MKDLLLFDVDNTLTVSRGSITKEMIECLKQCAVTYDIGCVSGSDLSKMSEQLGEAIDLVKWKCTENGLVSYCGNELVHINSMVAFIGEERYQKLVNSALRLLSTIELPVKRGTFLELRTGLLNICPIGRSCTQAERDAFGEFDAKHHVRQQICDHLAQEFPDLTFSIGGQISMDVFPKGWNKTYCLPFLTGEYRHIYFFGDNIRPGGNDYEIGIDYRVVGRSVKNWQNTMDILYNEYIGCTDDIYCR